MEVTWSEYARRLGYKVESLTARPEGTVKKIDGKLVATIPTEALERLGVSEGETLIIDGQRLSELLIRRAEVARKMEIAERIMDEDREILKKLATSERMDRVRAIMERYDDALAELAK